MIEDDLGEDLIIKEEKYEPPKFRGSIDEAFPKRDKEDPSGPSYRKHQKSTIEKIIAATTRFVGVEGPVGSGKTAINYTAGRLIGRTIYITPLTSLEDQLDFERWPDIRMVKGRGKYMCNFCKKDCRCNYDGDDDEMVMCQTSSQRKGSFTTAAELASNIIEVHKRLGKNAQQLGERSAFRSIDDYYRFIRTAVSVVRKYHGGDDRMAELDVVSSVACDLGDCECPVKSSRALAYYSQMVIMTPDIMYLLNKNEKSPYRKVDCVIYDECQKIESVIQRIFRASLPIKTTKDLFNVDLTEACYTRPQPEMMAALNAKIKSEVAPLLAATRVIRACGSIPAIRNLATSSVYQNRRKLADYFVVGCQGYLRDKPNQEISFLSIISHAFDGTELPKELAAYEPFVTLAREEFHARCETYKCDNVVSIRQLVHSAEAIWHGSKLTDERRRIAGKAQVKENKDESLEYLMPSKDAVFCNHMVVYAQLVEEFVKSFVALADLEKKDFMIDKVLAPTQSVLNSIGKTVSKMAEHYYHRFMIQKEDCIDIVPVDTGAIMNRFFYSCAREKVILSSGTWIGKESLYPIYGIPRDTSYVIVPTTFPPERRRVFLADKRTEMVNFSEKDETGIYLYQTQQGTEKYVTHLNIFLKLARMWMGLPNANAVVHTNSFDIMSTIARRMRGVDEKYLFQKQGENMLVNDHTKKLVTLMSREQLIDAMSRNPNSGLTVFSPSLSEGVDLINDVARLQVILKAPIPYWGDKYVQIRTNGDEQFGVEKNRDYTDYVTLTTVCQQYGRIMRSENDSGVTLILDQQLVAMLKRYLRSPEALEKANIHYLVEGIQYNKDGTFAWPFQ